MNNNAVNLIVKSTELAYWQIPHNVYEWFEYCDKKFVNDLELTDYEEKRYSHMFALFMPLFSPRYESYYQEVFEDLYSMPYEKACKKSKFYYKLWRQDREAELRTKFEKEKTDWFNDSYMLDIYDSLNTFSKEIKIKSLVYVIEVISPIRFYKVGYTTAGLNRIKTVMNEISCAVQRWDKTKTTIFDRLFIHYEPSTPRHTEGKIHTIIRGLTKYYEDHLIEFDKEEEIFSLNLRLPYHKETFFCNDSTILSLFDKHNIHLSF